MNALHARIAASFGAQGLMQTLGATLTLVEDGEVHIELPFSAHLSQQHGYIHAGAVTSVVDSACGYAALTQVADDTEVTTVEYKINFLAAFQGGELRAVGRVVKAGRRIVITTAEVFHRAEGHQESLCCVMQQTLVPVPKTG